MIVDADRAALLHFESCTYEMWRNKFSKHRHMEARKRVDIDKIPFAFYRESIRLFQACWAARWGTDRVGRGHATCFRAKR